MARVDVIDSVYAVNALRSMLLNRALYEEEVCQGRLSDYRYRPEADVPNWFLWSLGCRSGRLLNRDDPEWGLRWDRSDPVQKLVDGAHRLGAWRTFMLDRCPSLGDVVVAGVRARGEAPAACVFTGLSGAGWGTVQDGLWTKVGWAPHMSVRELRGDRLRTPEADLTVVGWIDLSRLEMEAQPSSGFSGGGF